MTDTLDDPFLEADPRAPIRARDVAGRWRISLRTLQRWRTAGYGPAHLRIGGGIYYRVCDVLAFEERQLRGGAGGPE